MKAASDTPVPSGGLTMKSIGNIKDSYISARVIGVSLAGAIAVVFGSYAQAAPSDDGVARWLITAAATTGDGGATSSASQSAPDTQLTEGDATDTSAAADPCAAN